MNNYRDYKERNISLDVAKGLAMILVVWLHAEGPYFAYISRLTVPAFFIVSGYLYNSDNSFKKFFVRKVHSLYIPFVFWNVLASATTAALGLILYKLGDFIKHIFLILLTVDKDGAVFGGSWFIASLFLMSITYKFVDYVLVKRLANLISNKLANVPKLNRVYKVVTSDRFVLGIRVSINLVIFAMLALGASYVTLPLRISRTIVLGFFYAVGVLIKYVSERKQNSRIRQKLNMNILKAFMTIVAAGLYISIASTCHTDLGFNVFENRGLYIIEVICGCFVLYQLSTLISRIGIVKKVLVYVGMHTIDIVLWQYVFFRVIIALQLYLNGQPISMVTQIYPTYDSSHGWWIVYTIFGVMTSLAFGEFLRRGPWGKLLAKYHIVASE